jgi:hypothetical protein
VAGDHGPRELEVVLAQLRERDPRVEDRDVERDPARDRAEVRLAVDRLELRRVERDDERGL